MYCDNVHITQNIFNEISYNKYTSYNPYAITVDKGGNTVAITNNKFYKAAGEMKIDSNVTNFSSSQNQYYYSFKSAYGSNTYNSMDNWKTATSSDQYSVFKHSLYAFDPVVRLFDQTAAPISPGASLSGKSSLKVEADIGLSDAFTPLASDQPQLIYALYNASGDLLEVRIQDIQSTGSKEETFDLTEYQSPYNVKVFLWTNMMPVQSIYSLK